MPVIEKNYFNLNISRYVSTAITEEEISLKATHKELVKATNTVIKAKGKHNAYLEELGLPLLP